MRTKEIQENINKYAEQERWSAGAMECGHISELNRANDILMSKRLEAQNNYKSAATINGGNRELMFMHECEYHVINELLDELNETDEYGKEPIV